MYKHYSKPYAILMLLLTYLKLFKIFITGKGNISLFKAALMGFPEKYPRMYIMAISFVRLNNLILIFFLSNSMSQSSICKYLIC